MKLSPCFALSHRRLKRGGCALVLACVALVGLWPAAPADAQRARLASHALSRANEPPGSLGFKRRIAGGQVGDDFFQPVRIVVPEGASVYPADAATDTIGPRQAVFGLQVGRPYRFVILNVPLLEDLPLYPSIELIGRTHPPQGAEIRFAIPIEFSREDLRAAAAGSYVERVVYVEDPDLALPVSTDRDSFQRVFDVDEDEDPLAVARSLGRPVAVVRLGAKAPDTQVPDDAFLFGAPPVRYFSSHSESGRVDRGQLKTESPVVNNPRLRRILP
jgi:hypothetical protein